MCVLLLTFFLYDLQGGFQLLVSIYDDDDSSADEHIDDVYVEGEVSPGGSIPNVSV